MLQSKLKSLGYKVERGEFHNYSTTTGKLIMDWLTKKWDTDQTTIELVMAANKQASQSWFKKLEDDGIDFLILDRYTLSQMVYGLATGSDGRWLSTLQNNMMRPNMDIVIDIPAEVSMTRKGKHNNGENDRYESDVKLLGQIRALYKKVSTDYSAPVKHIVDGKNSIDEIHERIFEIVAENFINGPVKTKDPLSNIGGMTIGCGDCREEMFIPGCGVHTCKNCGTGHKVTVNNGMIRIDPFPNSAFIGLGYDA